jgi:hypothetical protein
VILEYSEGGSAKVESWSESAMARLQNVHGQEVNRFGHQA